MKYYWVLYTYGNNQIYEDVIKEHPFSWRKYKPNKPVLLDWKHITKEEYLLFI